MTVIFKTPGQILNYRADKTIRSYAAKAKLFSPFMFFAR